MVEDGSRDFGGGKNGGERVLSQEEIDNLPVSNRRRSQPRRQFRHSAIIDSAMVSYERLPMLEIVFDRLVRLMTTSLRNFTSDNSRSRWIASLRCGRRLHEFDSAAGGAVRVQGRGMGEFRAGDGRFKPDLFDDRRAAGWPPRQTSLRIEGRPYTTIETNLVKRLV